MKKIILANGPARSGKDTVGSMVADLLGEVHITKFAHVLKCATHAMFAAMHGNSRPICWNSATDDAYYENRKGVPLPMFFDLSPREAYIAVSEVFIKPVFGQDFFGNVLAARLEQVKEDVVVVTDSGFTPEAKSLVDKFGA